jgi:hypothetical protein
MSCNTQKPLKCYPNKVNIYSNKVNIYTSNCFIPLPVHRSCPPPSMVMIGPGITEYGPCGPTVLPVAQPLYPPRPYMGSYNNSGGCGPCGK